MFSAGMRMEIQEGAEARGDYGPTIELTPLYRDDAQRVRLRPFFWHGAAPKAEFARAVGETAKAALASALARRTTKAARLRYCARLEGRSSEHGGPEGFELGVESIMPEDASESDFHRVVAATDASETAAALIEGIRQGVSRYLLDAGCPEIFTWKMDVTGYGGAG